MLEGAQFDVFYDDPFEPLLLASFKESKAAKAAMRDFALHVPGQYFVWSSADDELVAQLNTGRSLLRS